MKKTAKGSGFDAGFKTVLPRKKRRGGVLEDGSSGEKIVSNVQSYRFWRSEAGDTTESDSINMEKKCLVEKTSFDYNNGGALAGKNPNQTPTGSKIKTIKVLDKPLGKINFSAGSFDNNILSDVPVDFLFPLKKVVNVSVHKSFALNIGLDKISRKNFHEKCLVIRKMFSGIYGFGRASTPSKFSEIIQTTFISESSLVQASKKAADAKILINTNLKKSSRLRMSTEAVYAALSIFKIIKSIKMQLVRLWQKALIEFEQLDHANLVTAEWSILIRKDAVHVAKTDKDKKSWDKRDVHRALFYARVRCTTISFDFTELLDAVIRTTPVLRGTNLHWSSLVSSKCAKCEKLGHTSLSCVDDGKIFSNSLLLAFGGALWANIVSRLSFSLLFGYIGSVKSGSPSEVKPPLPIVNVLKLCFINIKSSIISLTEQIDELVKRLESLMPAVSQPSFGCQLPVTSPSQNQVGNIVMRKSSGDSTSGDIAVALGSSVSPKVIKLGKLLKELSALILSLSVHINSMVLAGAEGYHSLAQEHEQFYFYFYGVKTEGEDLPLDCRQKQHSKNNFKVAITPDATTLEYYQPIYTHCKQRFNIPNGIEVVKKSVYQYIENHINNYLFGNYNISEVRSNFYNNLVHYSQLETENLNKLNFNIIKYCEETYSVQSQYSIDFKSETETSNKGKQKLKQYSKTTPNTLRLPKTTAKHLQTPKQRTKDFTSPRSPTKQQKPLQTSSNLLDFLAENQSEHSETIANKENDSEISEEESIDSENEENKMTAYIAKISEFNGEDIETSLQEWLDQVTKAGDANGWNAAKMLRTIPYFLKGTAGKWFENLTTLFND
ncbi:hypothetical protein G9A89_015683 [Geosiphon pyriformis]|nr:hypothetical protein G9A89_015683 [Geosiphon pyriformis]